MRIQLPTQPITDLTGGLSSFRPVSSPLTPPPDTDVNIISYFYMDDDGIFPEVTTDANLISWWKFQEGSGTTLFDEKGDNNGVITGATWTGSGAFNASTNSLTFDGVNDSVSMGVTSDFDFAHTGQFSFEGWVYINSAGSGDRFLLGTSDGTDKGFFISIRTGNLFEFGMVQTGIIYTLRRSSALSNDTWYHVAGTWDNGTANVYINGSLNNDSLLTAGTMTSTIPADNNLKIGERPTFNDWDFNGRLDNFAIYNDVRTSAEILRDYRKMQSTYIADYVGTNHSLLVNDVAFVAPGAYGYAGDLCLTFDGTGDGTNAGNVASLNFERTDTFTMFARVRISVTGTYETIMSKRQIADNRGWEFFLSLTGTPSLILCNDNSPARFLWAQGDISVTDGEWHTVMVSYSGNSLVSGVKLYVDGVECVVTNNSDTLGSFTILSTGSFRIGTRDAGAIDFNGEIDNAIIFNQVRTPAQIENTYGLSGAFNPLATGADIVLSNNNLTATINNAGAWRTTKTTASFSSGIKAFEVTYVATDPNHPFYGFANASASLTTYIVSTVNGIAYRPTGEVWYNNAVVTSGLQTMSIGDQMLCAYNQVNNTFRIWYRAGGVGAYSEIGTGWTNKSSETLFGAVSMRNAQVATIRTVLSTEAITAITS